MDIILFYYQTHFVLVFELFIPFDTFVFQCLMGNIFDMSKKCKVIELKELYQLMLGNVFYRSKNFNVIGLKKLYPLIYFFKI